MEEAGRKLASGDITSRALTQSYLDAIAASNPKINAYITVTADEALAQADAADKRRANGESGPMLGVPIALKDNLCTKGTRTTCASKILSSFVPPYDATVVSRLRVAGAVFLGKTNLDEFAMGSSTEHSAFGPTQNPVAPGHIPGGSSGGSAAAVSGHLCTAALGSDTGGSIRQPAACVGIVGLKPTYGRVSRYGLVAFASSLDQIGPMTKSVMDAAIMLETIAGHDNHDSTSTPQPVPKYTTSLSGDLAKIDGRPVRLGIPKEYFVDGMDADVRRGIEDTIATYKKAGIETREVSLPHTQYAIGTYYLVATAEASSNLARYDGVQYGYRSPEAKSALEVFTKSRGEGFGKEVKRRIMLGTYALSAGYFDAYYLRALRVRTLIKRDFERAFAPESEGGAGVDALLTPVMPTPPFKLGERTADPLSMYLADIFTIATNLAGVPGLVVPCAKTPAGLPNAFQLMGPFFEETRLLRLGRLYENLTA